MKLDGFSVDSISSFCQHFYLPDLLEAIDSQVIFSKWLNDVLTLGSVEESAAEKIRQLKRVFEMWMYGADDGQTGLPGLESGKLAWNDGIMRQFELWKREVAEVNAVRYDHLCFILAILFEIGKYQPDEEDGPVIYDFLKRQHILKEKKLSLRVAKNGKVHLYYGDDLVTELPAADASWEKEMQIISMAQHAHTGYLAITQSGELVNGSAFDIAAPIGRAVKVQINQIAYAVLLEDGSIIHNLKFAEIPAYPVKNISLYGEQLSWIAMK